MSPAQEFAKRLVAGEHIQVGNLLFAALPPYNLYYKTVGAVHWVELKEIPVKYLEDIASIWHSEQQAKSPKPTSHIRRVEL